MLLTALLRVPLFSYFTVFISSNGQTYSYILNNRTITARLKVEKCDAETGNIIPMTGTGFQIKDLSTGEFVTQDILLSEPGNP